MGVKMKVKKDVEVDAAELLYLLLLPAIQSLLVRVCGKGVGRCFFSFDAYSGWQKHGGASERSCLHTGP